MLYLRNNELTWLYVDFVVVLVDDISKASTSCDVKISVVKLDDDDDDDKFWKKKRKLWNNFTKCYNIFLLMFTK
jgi:hypothetical protein